MSTFRTARSSARLGARAFLQRHLKLRQLRLLVALDHHRHVGRVAEALHITQPAVSKALSELEQGLGMQLFARTPRGLEPTTEGICLIRYAQAVDEDLGRAASALESIGQPDVWRVAVGAMHGATPVLQPALQRLERRRPQPGGFDLTVQEAPIDTLLTQLRAGRLDVVVGVAPERSAATDLAVMPLYADPMVWICACDHPLARRAGITLPDLAELAWVMPPRVARLRAVIDGVLRGHKLRVPPRVVETVSFDTVLGMVCDHGAVALSTLRLARTAESRGLVRVLDVDMGSLVLQIAAITLAEPAPGADVAEFVQCLMEASAHEAARR